MIIKIHNKLYELLESVICVVTFVMTAIAFYQLVTRYLFGFSYAGLDEINRLMFVWIVSIGSSLAFRAKAHMGVTFLANKLSDDKRKYFEVFLNMILIAFMLVVIKASIQMTKMGAKQISEYLEWSMAYFYACIPISSILSILVFLENIYNILLDIKDSKSLPKPCLKEVE